MNKILFAFLAFGCVSYNSYANDGTTNDYDETLKKDTVKTHFLEEVVVFSHKETNLLEAMPGAISVISYKQLDAMQVNGLPDISTLVPNFFVPDYGSQLTTPLYIRGVGNRITGQASGMYVDNVPILNKANYDVEFIDVHYIEILRGPQGTLFGRNSMGGMMNIATLSPLDYQRTKFGVTGGNYGLFRTKASTQAKLNDRFGFSVAGYYDRSDGYFINNYSGKKADPMESAGGHVRFDYQLSKRWKTSLSAHYNFSEQGAFPYHKYDKTTGVTEPVNYNDEGAYLRRMGLTALNLEYKDDNILFTSATSYQGLNDDMNMDQDYTPAPIYSIRQRQKQNAFTQELAVKSNKESNYRWSFGLFGSYDNFKTNISENWTSDGLQTFLDMILAPIKAGGARLPNITVAGEGTIPNPVSTKAVTSNAAIYHQSTYNNLFIDGLSITGGLRLDYGKTSLDYQSAMEMRLLVDLTSVVPYPVPPVSLQGDTTLQGFLSMNHFMLLPKIALKYEWNRRNYVYASATKGFNPGGYNIQMFAETITQILIGKMANGYMPATNPIDWGKDAAFNPEYNWTYELGYKGEWLNRRLSAEIALFYVDMHDMQLAKTVSFGRELTNAGKAVSKGIDLHVDARICAGLTAAANYGYIHATFKEYDNGKADLKGYYLPFVPRQTFSICAAYEKNFTRSFVKRFDVQVQYNGADKIYWTEANDVTQDFYSLLNLKSGVTKGHFTLNIWAKNLLNTHYHAFYFADVLGNAFLQQGKPALWGVDLVVAF